MSAKSSAIRDGEDSWIKATVAGKGVFTFKWKVDCEEDYSGEATWDHLEVLVDEKEFARIDGKTGWTEQTIPFTTGGDHTIYWAYIKDEDESAAGYSDCAWLADCKWTSEASFPEAKTEAEVSAALNGVRDTRLTDNITTVEKYAAFLSWVETVAKTDATTRQKVRDSSLAWFAYALDLETLPETAPESLSINEIAANDDGAWSLSVSVGDLSVGSDADVNDLKTVFSVEGATELTEASFSPDNVKTTFSAPQDGKVKVSVAPKNDAGRFFIRMKMTP